MVINDIWKIIIAIIIVPFTVYTIFRVVSAAVFKSWFELKSEYMKGEKLYDRRKEKKGNGEGGDAKTSS